MDVIGPITPPTAKGRRCILAITNYFSKWMEAIPFREMKTSNKIKFIKHHVIYRYGIPRQVVRDNGHRFFNQAFQRFCNKFRTQSISSTACYPAANSLVEAFNKIINKLLKKFISKSQCDWDEKLCECLWAYHTTLRTLTKATPFSLMHGCEVMLSLEIQIPSL